MKNKKKPRFTASRIILKEEDIDPHTNRVNLDFVFNIPDNTVKAINLYNNKEILSNKIIHGYWGENKQRILVEISKDENDDNLDIVSKLSRFNQVIAIDTNSMNINDKYYHLGVSCHIIKSVNKTNISEWIIYPINHLFVLIGNYDKPENENWQQLIEYIIKHKNYNSNDRIAIVVDSDLGNLEIYNEHNKPISNHFFLPNNFEFIYASDKAGDTILNHAIITCHKLSKELLDKLVLYI